MKIVTVVGARPQFIKAAPMSRAIRARSTELLVHTGQHYDDNMSEVFFRELGIPAPDVHLGVGPGSHAQQTAKMIVGLEEVLIRERPDWLLVYGDTNSTVAAALAAAKVNVPIAHVEAGLRSFNRRMPEEVNRVVADHLSALLFCPSALAAENLEREGITSGVKVVGDVMADALFHAVQLSQNSDVLSRLGLAAGRYIIATIHRAENTDSLARLREIVDAIGAVGLPVLFPIHPRTSKAISASHLVLPRNVVVCPPLGYLDLVRVLQDARLCITDSGGLQKEAYWLGVPCITVREETEWVETVEAGWNVLAGCNKAQIISAVTSRRWPNSRPALYGGDGKASDRIVAELCSSADRFPTHRPDRIDQRK